MFAFFVLADLGLNLDSEYGTILVQSLILLALMFAMLGLVIVIHRSISKSLDRIRVRELGGDAESEQGELGPGRESTGGGASPSSSTCTL